MPSRYKVDLPKCRVLSTASGVLSYKDATDHNHRLRKDPLFDPAYAQLYDFRAVTRVALTADDLLELSRVRLFSPDSKRAFVTSGPVNYALARMYGVYRSLLNERGVRVFSEMEDAVAWLDGEESHDGADQDHVSAGEGAGAPAGQSGTHRTAKHRAR